ncbi:hypothetical protein OCH239_14320 [Roseivivax halodurans JCM 10272]|uniref:DUF4177 domain-containing protein n=1 Tax=Roseivivax halodurans JCM 10272 TaxID=1449350 RepID=X7EIA1_9RHOB|nr:DUF4177 domain-containing protein [Roseivivax halodurans]ETX15615.1 hypothetical protein OCH239_14320 [Roseivivax halodurans JCM 10272]
MPTYEYKVLPAPAKGEKAKGVKGPEARFAHALERLMNEMAEGGWEYLRADTLPSEERQGLTSSTTVWRTLLVFRRESAGDGPRLLSAPTTADEPMVAKPKAAPAPGPADGAASDALRRPGPAAERTGVLRAPGRMIGRRAG